MPSASDLFLRPTQETMTCATTEQTALPMRDYGIFLPGNGVGGAGVHWNGQTWRFCRPISRSAATSTKRYGEGSCPRT